MGITRKNESMWRVYDPDENLLGKHHDYKEAVETRDEWWATGNDGDVKIVHSDAEDKPYWEIHEKPYSTVQPEPEPEPEPEPVPEPPTIPDGERVTIYVSNDGDDANDGLTESTAVATNARVKDVFFHVRNANKGKFIPITMRFRAGDSFAPMDLLLAVPLPPSTGHFQMNGRADNPTIFDRYGDGENPVFSGAGSKFRMKHGSSVPTGRGNHFAFRNLRVVGGSGISWQEGGKGLTIEDCDFDDANITIQCLNLGHTYDDLVIRRTKIRNCTSRGGHRSGIFLNYVGNWTIDDCLLYRNGWNGNPSVPDAELGDDVHNHGLYATAFCTPAKSFKRNICIFNAGAGAQLREGGYVEDNFIAWNGQTGLIFVADGGNKNDNDPGEGSIIGNFITDHFYVGTNITDCDNVPVTGNWFVQGTDDIGGGKKTNGGPRGYTVMIDSIHGENYNGGTWHGINRMVWENNVVVGKLNLRRDGWGVMGGDGLLIKANNLFTGKIERQVWPDKPHLEFADPNGKVVIENEAGQINQPNPGVAIPDRDALQSRIDSGELDAAQLIEMHTT